MRTSETKFTCFHELHGKCLVRTSGHEFNSCHELSRECPLGRTSGNECNSGHELSRKCPLGRTSGNECNSGHELSRKCPERTSGHECNCGHELSRKCPLGRTSACFLPSKNNVLPVNPENAEVGDVVGIAQTLEVGRRGGCTRTSGPVRSGPHVPVVGENAGALCSHLDRPRMSPS